MTVHTKIHWISIEEETDDYDFALEGFMTVEKLKDKKYKLLLRRD